MLLCSQSNAESSPEQFPCAGTGESPAGSAEAPSGSWAVLLLLCAVLAHCDPHPGSAYSFLGEVLLCTIFCFKGKALPSAQSIFVHVEWFISEVLAHRRLWNIENKQNFLTLTCWCCCREPEGHSSADTML